MQFVDENAVLKPATTDYYSAGSSNQNLDRVDQRQPAADLRFRMPHQGNLVRIFIVDSGVQPVANFGTRVDTGISFVGGNPLVDGDVTGHGTAMASLAASSAWGIARNARVVPVQVYINSFIQGPTLNNVVSGLQWISQQSDTHGVVNISLEFASPGGPNSLDTQITALKAKGLVVTVAAGNNNVDSSGVSPANVPDALTVGAMNVNTGGRWVNGTSQASDFGTVLDLFAPGASAKHDNASGGVQADDGTSCSAAYTSGTLAALIETDVTMTSAVVQSRLTGAATANALTGSLGTGSPNLLLFSDVQPSLNSSAEIASGQTVFCPNLGFTQPLNKTVLSASTDTASNRYYTYSLAAPAFCYAGGPFNMPCSLIVEKRNSANALQWSATISSGLAITESAPAMAINASGEVYVAGATGSCGGGSCPGGADAFVAKLSSNGVLAWKQTFGTAFLDSSNALALLASDPANVYVGGTTGGVFSGQSSAGGNDGFVASLSVSTGAVTVRKQFGTSGNDTVAAMLPRSDNATFSIVGTTTGSIPGYTNHGGYDVFLGAVLYAGGSFQFFPGQQIGTSGDDLASAAVVSTDHLATSDTLYFAGRTTGSLGGANVGGYDVFVGPIDDVVTNSPVWLAQAGTSLDDYAPGLAVGPDDVFVASGYELLKFSRPVGSIAWRESLARIAQVTATTGDGVATTFDSAGQAQAFVTNYGSF